MDFNVFISLAFLIGFCHAERALMDYAEFVKIAPYRTEPKDSITITCFFSVDSSIRNWATVNNENLKTIAVKMAQTGKGLSVYFDDNERKSDWDAEKKWHRNSETNICTVSYQLSSGKQLSAKEKKKEEEEAIVQRCRLELLAFKFLRVFEAIQSERTNLLPQGGKVDATKDLKVVGLGIGAHVAALFCRYILSHLNAVCLFLLGLDPATNVPGISRESFIRIIDAAYVQMIYTSFLLYPGKTIDELMTENHMHFGDATIIVESNCFGDSCRRSLALQMHEQIAAGELTMYTTETNRYNVMVTNSNSKGQSLPADAHHCMIGVYEGRRSWGTFKINVFVSTGDNNKFVFDVQRNFIH